MPITDAQKAQAELAQLQAAQDAAPQVRLVAGPGTGKSATLERRVAHVLNNGAAPGRVYVISFTRATCAELRSRVATFCANQPCALIAPQVSISTMHSLALRILRSAQVLATLYPDDPIILDDLERINVYDVELSHFVGCSIGRAAELREAYDAQWQTLNPQTIALPPITAIERQRFTAFHTTRRNLYSCVLVGEVVYECVHRLQQGDIQPNQLPAIDHLVVDEFQDLNACDQEFVRRLSNNGAVLFVAGDDDQSIYSFRHANPSGIVQFTANYPASATHKLSDCFRCTPVILELATNLIVHNPQRIPKQINSLYSNSIPPLQGKLYVWSLQSAESEAAATAQSCHQLIQGGMAGQEDQIVILISNRRLQLNLITQELGNLGLPFDPPGGQAIRDEPPIRAAYSVLRLIRDQTTNVRDYVTYRSLLGQLHGSGNKTNRAIAEGCIDNHQNFRGLFHLPALPDWLDTRSKLAVTRIQEVIQQIGSWTLQDTIGTRSPEIAQTLSSHIFNGSANRDAYVNEWTSFAASLPQEMTLEELLLLLGADDEAEQRQIIDTVNERLSQEATAPAPAQKRIRILTMHGAKGLSGKVVFIPSAEQGIMPSFRAIQAVGLLIEQRRLFYVSLTRAKAACIVSHAALHSGAAAFMIRQQPQVRLPRSQFLNEMNVASVNRNTGLSAVEAAQIISEVNNL